MTYKFQQIGVLTTNLIKNSVITISVITATLFSACSSLEEREVASGSFDYVKEQPGRKINIPDDVDSPKFNELALGDQVGDSANLAQRIVDTSARYGLPLDPEQRVATLSTGEKQRVEIVRCLLLDIQLLILDEPTSVLTPQEVERLFETLRLLSQEGCSILFISHKLHEVVSLCDKATILRHGQKDTAKSNHFCRSDH